MLYLDSSATTPVKSEVLEAMLPYLAEEYGNPSSKYYNKAVKAREAVELARSQVADLLKVEPDEVIFTSGASESNNMIIKGMAEQCNDRGLHIITSCVEHKSVLETCRYLALRGYDVTFLPVDNAGRVDPESLRSELRSDTILVSIQWANNEVGTINDIETMAALCFENEIAFHSDATQVIGKIPLALDTIPLRFLSLSAHKFHGPKGIGACIIRKDAMGLKTQLPPLIHGGSQENGYRAGTHAVHNIVGMGKAAEIAQRDLTENYSQAKEVHFWLIKQIQAAMPVVCFNGDWHHSIPGLINLTIPGVSNEILAIWLGKQDIAVATGSACSVSEPSYVLQAMGLPLELIRQSIRISLDSNLVKDDLLGFIRQLQEALA